MEILYDGFIFAIQRAGGINRYFRNVIDRLPGDITAVLTSPERREHCFPSNPRLRCFCPPRDVFGSGKLTTLAKRLYLNGIERGRRADLVHPTYHELFSGKPFSSLRPPVVLTIHDMIHERFGPSLDPSGREAALKRAAIEAADAIICVSENTKRDLIAMRHVPEERITVIPLSSEVSAAMASSETAIDSGPYVLFVGSRAFYKNFARLLLAFNKAASVWPDLRLVVVGSPFSQTEQEWLCALRLEGRVVLQSEVDDAQLAALYRDAQALVYPSLYEGFGIPLLEAMACGTVVIAARSSSIPEVVGDAAILFDPYSVDELADHLLGLRQLGGKREEYIRLGRERAAGFSWESTAARTVAIYRRLAK